MLPDSDIHVTSRLTVTMGLCTLVGSIVAIALFGYQTSIINARIANTLATTTLAAATFVSLTMTPFLMAAAAVSVAIALRIMATSFDNIPLGPAAALRAAFLAELGRIVAASLAFVAKAASTAEPAISAGMAPLFKATFAVENLIWAVLLFWFVKRFTKAPAAATFLVCGGVFLLRSSWLLLRFVVVTT
ncbi:MAG: hypothetical protein ABI852_06560 [Gemmatimonadaceae bacterium]